MFEIIMLIMIGFLFAAGVFSSSGGGMRLLPEWMSVRREIRKSRAVGAGAGRHQETSSFLNYLRTQIEAELHPRPTCSVQRRHYDAMVAVELEYRLALMAE